MLRRAMGRPRPAAGGVIASTVFMFPYGLQDPRIALAALPMVLVPGLLMVSTIRFRSVKAIDVGWHRSYFGLFFVAVVLALIASHPRIALVTLAYGYTVGALVMWVYTRARRRPGEVMGGEPIQQGTGDPKAVSSSDSGL